MECFRRVVRDNRGATAIEYGLIACVLALAIIATLPMLRPGLNTAFETVSTGMVEITADIE